MIGTPIILCGLMAMELARWLPSNLCLWLGVKIAGPPQGGVDVQPDVVLFADLRERTNWVVGTEDGSTSCGVEVEGCTSFFFCLFDQRGEGIKIHTACFCIDGNGSDG